MVIKINDICAGCGQRQSNSAGSGKEKKWERDSKIKKMKCRV